MKGKPFVIGLVLFVIIVVATIYFLMMATINDIKDEQGLASIVAVEILADESEYSLAKAPLES